MSAGDQFFLGRQPILDRDRRIVAYELLFRSRREGGAGVTDEVEASATVITRALGDLGIDRVLGGRQAFVNIGPGLLGSDLMELLPSDQVVLELLEDVRPTAEVVERCRDLQAQGFRLAIDNYVGDDARCGPLCGLADIVKVDIEKLDDAALAVIVARLRTRPLTLIAGKVETREQADYCHTLGFHLFQGYFYARPVVLSGRRQDTTRTALLQLLSLVLREADVAELEAVFRRNPKLTYNLLRLVNSVAMARSQRIASLGHAIAVLGLRQLQRWVQLLLFTVDQDEADRGNPLLLLAAARARLMELLATRQDPTDRAYPEQAFMAGMLSLADAALDIPLTEIVIDLRLAEPVEQALLHGTGRLGALLAVARGLENMDFAAVAARLDELPGLDLDCLAALQIEAIAWAQGIAEEQA